MPPQENLPAAAPEGIKVIEGNFSRCTCEQTCTTCTAAGRLNEAFQPDDQGTIRKFLSF